MALTQVQEEYLKIMYILGQTKDGLFQEAAELVITGGTIEGEDDGVRTHGRTRIGEDDGSISIEVPKLIGHTHYGLETTAYTAFYDGVLEGIPDGYLGLINIIPAGTSIHEDYEFLRRNGVQKKYQKRYW